MSEAHERVKSADDASVGELLELKMALAGDSLHRTGTEEHGSLDLLVGKFLDLVDDVAVDDIVGEVSGSLKFRALSLESLDIFAEKAGHKHRCEAAGHGEASVVGSVREYDDEILARHGYLGKLAVRVAGNDQMIGALAEFVGDLVSCDALRAVA